MKAAYSASVFINCPFDAQYRHMLFATVFAVLDCGYQPRCAQEVDDGGEVRLEKIKRIIEQCKFGIHDISRTELNDQDLPRFNMPFELGLFLGARHFGASRQGEKVSLIMDRAPFRYQAFFSDIAGHDIADHQDQPEQLIAKVRNWLSAATRRSTIPGAARIQARHLEFRESLPQICQGLDLDPAQLLFNEYAAITASWLQAQEQI